ncbi:MAG: thioredoxin domain-containing protein [Terracidiphilus sp.]
MPRPTSLLAALFILAASAHAQFSSPPTQVRDTSALHPPAGARVAIVEFIDLECPVCASTNPIVEAAAAKYKIPLIRHDFLIPAHAWSPIAATNARWFDLKSKALGDEYRDAVFAAQPTLYNNSALLHDFTQNFAAAHHIALPFSIDPQGKLLAELQADNNIGIRLGIDHTPTVFIVTSGSTGRPFIEVQRPATDLYTVIDEALADTGSPGPQSTPAASAASPTTPDSTSAAPPPQSSASTPPASPAPPHATTPTAPPTTPLAPTGDQPPTDHPSAGFPPAYMWALAAAAALILAAIVFVVVRKKRQPQ